MEQQPSGVATREQGTPAASDTAGPPLPRPVSVDLGQEWASVPTGGLTKEVEVELYGTTRSVSPGAIVVVRYAINSYEDTDHHVRMRLVLPDGWVLLDRDVEAREFFLESWETIEGELRVSVPKDARAGERHRVRVLGEVVGEPGAAAVYANVQVVRRGGLKAGAVGLTGTASVQATSLAIENLDGARYGGVVDLTGNLGRGTTLSLLYREGPRESTLTNYRIAQEDTRWSGTLRSRDWQVQFGNQVNSMGNVLTGPYVRGQGLSVRRTQGLFVGDVVVAQPTTFNSAPAGHLVRGTVGIAGTRGRAALAFSDFGRPVGGYSTAPIYPPDIHPDSLEQLERERRAAAQAPSNRVQGAGADMELRLGKVHRINVRGGWLRLHNAAGDSVAEPSAEAQYAFTHRAATLNARWRRMPESLQGVQLPGDELAVDASLKLIGEWRVAGRGYRSSNHTLRHSYQSENEGASLGVRYFRQGWRLDVRGNHREWSYGAAPTVARTVNVTFGMPVGPLTFSGFADVGAQRQDTLRRPTESYRADLRWAGRAGSLAWSASYYETLNVQPRLRTDVLGSLKLGDWEMAGGAWATRGWLSGGDPGIWTQVGVPVTYDLQLTLGIEHAPPDWGKQPQWLGTVGVRKKVALAIPFLRSAPPQPE